MAGKYRPDHPVRFTSLTNCLEKIIFVPLSRMKNGKILVIDDEEQLRKALSRIIELEGYEVLQAGTAVKGLKILEIDQEILVVICDVRLPDINGMEVLRTIRSLYPQSEVILLTAYGTIPGGVHAMKQGAFDYITKGDGDEQIVVTLEKAPFRVGSPRTLGSLKKMKNGNSTCWSSFSWGDLHRICHC